MVRALVPGDLEAWTAFRRDLWPEADAGELANEARAFLATGTQPTLTAVFVADDGSSPVGCIELSIRPFSDGCESMPVPHVEGWYVEPRARGRGVGRALVQAAEGWARALGFTELASDAELSNEASQRAHAGCGFEETERLVKFRKRLA